MSHFKLLTRLSFVTFACLAVYANTPSDDFIIEKENKTIEAILKADENIGTRSNKSLNEEKTLAMLCVVTNFILSEKKEVLDQPTVFNVAYTTGTDLFGNATVTPTGTITSPDQKIEYFIVNGDTVPVNAMSYTFAGSVQLPGTTLDIKVKLEGKTETDDYSA